MEGKEHNSNKRQSQSPNKKLKSPKELDKFLRDKSDEITYEVNAKNAIYFKIVHNEKEFIDFQGLNFENVFHPTYTYELFQNEKINGYKGIKILISLTPKRLYSHINIIYAKKLDVSDDVEKILSEHFKDAYCTSNVEFLEKLKSDISLSSPKGLLVCKDKSKSIYTIDILEDGFESENLNFQALCPFFIDAASFIPLETNFWSYFLEIEDEEKCAECGEKGGDDIITTEDNIINTSSNISNWHTVGFCSYKNFHLQQDKYTTMLSQFLILNPYQRKGFGTYMLQSAYNFLGKEQIQCREITTEDPDLEFILMRDITIIKLILENNFLEYQFRRLKSCEITTKEDFDLFILSDKEIKSIASALKLQENLIERTLEFILYSMILNSKELNAEFTKHKKEKFSKMLIKNTDINQAHKTRNKGPFISFYDDPDYDPQKIIQENESENPAKSIEIINEKVNIFFFDYKRDLDTIVEKIKRIVCEYKKKLG